MALGGDATAIRLCLDRLIAPRSERPVSLTLPEIKTRPVGFDRVAEQGDSDAPGHQARNGRLPSTLRRALAYLVRASRMFLFQRLKKRS
jgi:hypothetical protein